MQPPGAFRRWIRRGLRSGEGSDQARAPIRRGLREGEGSARARAPIRRGLREGEGSDQARAPRGRGLRSGEGSARARAPRGEGSARRGLREATRGACWIGASETREGQGSLSMRCATPKYPLIKDPLQSVAKPRPVAGIPMTDCRDIGPVCSWSGVLLVGCALGGVCPGGDTCPQTLIGERGLGEWRMAMPDHGREAPRMEA